MERLTTLSCLAAVLVLTTAALPAQPRLGAIRGRVEIRRLFPPPERRPSVAELGAPAPREITDMRRTVVYLETAPAAALESREPMRARMDQRNETFLPHVLAVDVGTVVDFPNNDTTYHNVFSLSKTRKFDLGRYAQGKSKPIRFDRPGVVRVFCDIHSHECVHPGLQPSVLRKGRD
jgi:plastocyanin